MDDDFINYYELLGVSEYASWEIIKAAFDEKYEKATDLSERVQLDNAYYTLSLGRAEYDKKLRERSGRSRPHPRNDGSQPQPPSQNDGPQPQPPSQNDGSQPQPPSQNDESRPQPPSQNDDQQQEDDSFKVHLGAKRKGQEHEEFISLLKTMGVATLTFFAGGPIGVAAYAWIKKISLQKGTVHERITKITTDDQKLYEEYQKNLDKQIDRLLSEPNNNYKLQVLRIKYENLIMFIEKRLDICTARELETKREVFRNKVDIASLQKQLDKARKKLASINTKIARYEENNLENNKLRNVNYHRLSHIYTKIEETDDKIENMSDELNGISGEIERRKKQAQIKKLQIYRKSLLEKRNQVGTRIKLKAVKKTNHLVLAKGFSHSKVFKGFYSTPKFERKYAETFAESEERRRISM